MERERFARITASQKEPATELFEILIPEGCEPRLVSTEFILPVSVNGGVGIHICASQPMAGRRSQHNPAPLIFLRESTHGFHVFENPEPVHEKFFPPGSYPVGEQQQTTIQMVSPSSRHSDIDFLGSVIFASTHPVRSGAIAPSASDVNDSL